MKGLVEVEDFMVVVNRIGEEKRAFTKQTRGGCDGMKLEKKFQRRVSLSIM